MAPPRNIGTPVPPPPPRWSEVPNLTQGVAAQADASQATSSTAGLHQVGAGAAQSTATDANAQKVNVGDNQLVENRINGIIDKNSPLMQQAATEAKQQMASRGLVNSSMAVGAGQAALYKTALPIAAQDANTYAEAARQNAAMGTDVSKFNAGNETQNSQYNANAKDNMQRFNVDAANTNDRFNASQQQQNSQFNAQLSAQNSQFNAQARNDMQQFNISAEAAIVKQGMDSDTRVQLANIEANYQTLMQASQSAGNLYSQMLTNISNIQNNKDMSAEAKNAAVQAQYAYLQNGMGIIAGMNNIDLGDLLNFEQPPGFPPTPPPPEYPGFPPPPPGAPPPYWEDHGGGGE